MFDLCNLAFMMPKNFFGFLREKFSLERDLIGSFYNKIGTFPQARTQNNEKNLPGLPPRKFSRR